MGFPSSRKKKHGQISVVALAAALGLTAPFSGAMPAFAQKVTVSGQEALGMAQKLFEAGELDRAEEILRVLVTSDPEKVDHVQAAILTGLIASERGEHDAAIEIFRQVLDAHPDNVVARFHLGRNLFELKRDSLAAYHFKLALEDGLSDEVKQTIQAYLRQIEQRRTWRFGFSAALAPDTNISSGSTTDQHFATFGNQTRQLQDVRQKKSGIGFQSSLSATYTPRLFGSVWAEARGVFSLTDYSGAEFDTAYQYIEAGPSIRTKRIQVSALGNISKRQLANDDFSTSQGARLLIRTPLTSRTGLSFRVSANDVDYNDTNNRDGTLYSVGATVTRALDQQTFGAISFDVAQENTEDSVQENMRYTLGLSLSRELPLAITAQVSPYYTYRDYQTPNEAFLTDTETGLVDTQLDQNYGVSISLTKRDWRVRSFAPIFTYRYAKTSSNLSLVEFDRHSFEFGLTRNF